MQRKAGCSDFEPKRECRWRFRRGAKSVWDDGLQRMTNCRRAEIPNAEPDGRYTRESTCGSEPDTSLPGLRVVPILDSAAGTTRNTDRDPGRPTADSPAAVVDQVGVSDQWRAFIERGKPTQNALIESCQREVPR